MLIRKFMVFALIALTGCSTLPECAPRMPIIGHCYLYSAVYLVYGDTPDAHVILERDKMYYPDAFGRIEPVVARYGYGMDYRIYREGYFTKNMIKSWINNPGYRVVICYLRHAAPARNISDVWLKPITEVHVMRGVT